MKLETFFEKFDQFADAPNAVAKMRELVLQWAVQGRLVRQDSNEEPVSKLIRDALQARIKLVAAKVVRDETPDLGFLDQVENGLPNGWVLAPLSVYVGVIMGQSPPSSAYNDSGEGLPFYQGKSQFGKLYPTATDWCTEPTKIGEPGDVVISVRAPVGPTNVLREKSCIGRGLTSLRSLGGDQMHLLYTLRAYERSIAAMGVGSTFVAISKSDLDDFRIPIPPLAEQKRIVAKVDELMALCDRLEAQQQERETRHAALTRASLARFADAPTLANLPFLFHPSYAIPPADLRKSILTLAVQGKLVPQDTNDEDASQQLEAIQARKAELVRKQVIKKSDPSRAVDPDEVDHDIPDSWAWVRLVEICELITDGTHLTPKYTESGRMFLSAQNVKPFKFMPAKHRFVSEEHYQGYVKSRKPEKGDVLLTRVGAGIGEAATIDQDLDFAIYVSLGLVRPVRGFVFSDYITLWLNSPDGTEKSSRNTYGKGVSQGNLNLSLIRNFLVPLPPLAEQRRIVAKVEQLMALVDELETQLAASRATAANLLSALVAELTANS